jgi:hypothetical protein
VEFEKKEELIPMFFKLFHKTESERMLPNSWYEASFTLTPPPPPQQKENYTDRCLAHTYNSS